MFNSKYIQTAKNLWENMTGKRMFVTGGVGAVQPRRIHSHNQVKQLEGLVALASGPLVYCIEEYDNEDLDHIKINKNEPLTFILKIQH